MTRSAGLGGHRRHLPVPGRRIGATLAVASSSATALLVVGIVLVVVGVAGVVGGAARAGAHEGEGELAVSLVDPPDPRAPGSVRYRVLLTYVNDGHPAPDATVTVVAEGAAAAVGPLPMAEATEGTYEATVAFPSPGTWTVRFTAVTPAAVLELTQELPAAATTTVASTVPSTTTVPSATAPSTTAAGTAPTATTGGPGDGEGGGGDGGGGVWPVVLVALGAGAVVAVGATVLVRSRRPGV